LQSSRSIEVFSATTSTTTIPISKTIQTSLSLEAEISFTQNILPSFALNIAEHIHQTLETYLPSIPFDDRQTRQSLLTQLLYCAQSLARVGCDFTDIVIGTFFDGAEVKEEEWAWEVTSAHRQRMAKLLQTTV
jgi:hypothetical protein